MPLPPMSYFGGKTRMAPRIARILPPHQHYVEPFAGSLAVLLAKKPSRMETVNDLDGRLMTFWRVLRDKPGELARVCALTPHSRADYLEARAVDTDALSDEVEIARLVWIQIAQGRNGTLRATGWRTYINPCGSSKSMPGYLDAYVERMAAAAERLHNVSLECRPAAELIEQYGAHPAVCLYVDPPYLGQTRSDSGSGYRLDMRGPGEHAELLEMLLRCRASVVLSGYASPMYDAGLDAWHRIEIPTKTSQGRTVGLRTEIIWSNRPISDQLRFEGIG